MARMTGLRCALHNCKLRLRPHVSVQAPHFATKHLQCFYDKVSSVDNSFIRNLKIFAENTLKIIGYLRDNFMIDEDILQT